MKKGVSWLAIGLAAVVTLIACAANINSLVINRDTGTKQWNIHNPILASDIKVLAVKEETKDGILFVNILLKNGWHMPIGGKLKVLFYDQNGVELADPWGWHQILLEAAQEQWFKFVAPEKAAEVSKIKLMLRGVNRYAAR